MQIGIAGLGKMGSAIAARLTDSGESVTVWNRSPERAISSGLPFSKTLAGLLSSSDVIITSVFDDDAVKEVYLDKDGLLSAASGKLFIEMSTVRPATQRLVSEAATAAGGRFIECPVGGTTGPARTGQLLGLAGGTPHDIELARPLLEKLCRRIVHMGPVGTGTLTKLAINLPLVVFWQSLGEAMALVRNLGKDPDWMVELFCDTAGAANVLKIKAQSVVASLNGNDSVVPTFSIDAMRKDLELMLMEADAIGVVLPAANSALESFNALSAAGSGEKDCVWATSFQSGWQREYQI